MSTVHMPTAKDVRDLLVDLVGRDITMNINGPMVDPKAPGGAMVGTYVDKRGTLRALAVVDLPAAAHLGAALGLVPAGGAEAAIEDGILPDSFAANTAEVLNIMASLFNVDDAVHLRLDRTYVPGALLPPNVTEWVTAWVDRLNLAIDIKGYGAGAVCVVSGF